MVDRALIDAVPDMQKVKRGLLEVAAGKLLGGILLLATNEPQESHLATRDEVQLLPPEEGSAWPGWGSIRKSQGPKDEMMIHCENEV